MAKVPQSCCTQQLQKVQDLSCAPRAVFKTTMLIASCMKVQFVTYMIQSTKKKRTLGGARASLSCPIRDQFYCYIERLPRVAVALAAECVSHLLLMTERQRRPPPSLTCSLCPAPCLPSCRRRRGAGHAPRPAGPAIRRLPPWPPRRRPRSSMWPPGCALARPWRGRPTFLLRGK